MKPKNHGTEAPPRPFLISLVACLVSSLMVLIAGLREIPQPRLWKGKPAFDAKSAYNYTDHLARGYPNRVPWRPEREAASTHLQDQLSRLGYAVSTIEFDEVIAGKKVEGLEDIFAILPGTELTDEYIVVLAHYDITDTTVEGAADDASGVGTVLELARVLKQSVAPRRNIVFLLTDSEEFGAFWGAHTFVKQFPHASQIVAAVSLDFVAPDVQESIMVLVDGLKTGYAPLWLRELALASVRAVPFQAEDTRHIVEHVQRALLIPPSDHGAFLMAGVPALNLFGKSTDFSHEMGRIHHTPEDNMTHMKVESFEPYGKAAEILLRSIDLLPPLLTDPNFRDPSYWKISDRYYIIGRAITVVHFLLFVPFLVYVVLLLRRLRGQRKRIVNVMRNEAKGFSLLLVSFIVGYVVLRELPDLDIIEKYEMFPATQKSLMLYRPVYAALLLILAVIVGLYQVLAKVFASRADRPSRSNDDRAIRHSLLGVMLIGIIMLAFLKNTFLTTLLLLPPAYLWMFMKTNRKFDSRLLNSLLLLGGMVSFIAICIAMTMVFHVGIFYWYLFLAISYGLISVYAAILAFAVITVGIRILRNLIL